MSVRDEVVETVDQLSPDDLVTVHRILRGLVGSPVASARDPGDLLENAPVDKDPTGEAEEEAVRQAWRVITTQAEPSYIALAPD